jgi:hypothetical protein
MLDRLEVAIAQLAERDLALRRIDLLLLLFQPGECALRRRAVCGSQGAPDFLAATFEPRIVNAVR